MISPFYLKHKNNMHIHIFKTNVSSKKDVNMIGMSLSSNPKIMDWSIDLEDIDKVLRIEAHKNLCENDIVEDLITSGFYCEVLE